MNTIVYVGMDVHKESYTLCCYCYDKDLVEYRQTVSADYRLVLKYLERVREHYEGDVSFVCGYEAGCVGYSLYHQLTDHAVDCKILAPTTMAITNTNRVKTDRKDAANIARCLAFHTYSEVYVPDEQDNQVKEYHKEFYDGLREQNLDSIDSIDICIDGYLESYDNEQIRPEASANFIALWSLLLFMMRTPELLKNRPAALMQVAAKDKKAKEIIDNPSDDFEKDALEAMSEMNDPEMIEVFEDMMTSVKHSCKWADLADYYLAMRYIWGIADNDLGWEFNRRVGLEMLNSFVSVGNVYAARFLKYSFDSMRQSQIVDKVQVSNTRLGLFSCKRIVEK